MLQVLFAWDPSKSEANLKRRGFDFEFATRVFEGRAVVTEDCRRDYGERRFTAIGVIGSMPFTVVYTDRETADGTKVRRIISARRSNRRERAGYWKTATAAARPRTS
jgi:hypothetical protein